MTSTSEHTDRHGRCLGPGCTIELDGYFCSARCIESWQERYGEPREESGPTPG